jgi:hypothetical protein
MVSIEPDGFGFPGRAYVGIWSGYVGRDSGGGAPLPPEMAGWGSAPAIAQGYQKKTDRDIRTTFTLSRRMPHAI